MRWIKHVVKASITAYKRHGDFCLVRATPASQNSLVYHGSLSITLGRMGAATYIAGASDNASGSAMLLGFVSVVLSLNTALHRTSVFIWFGAEEAGLVGSKVFR